MFKKVFAAMLAGLFISAPAFAEVKMSGSYFLKGNYRQEAADSIAGVNTEDPYRYYESDLEIKTQIIIDETTSVNITAEAFDTNWVDNSYIAGTGADSNGQNFFEISKATLNHKFTTGTAFVGGVSGNSDSWGTAFGDEADRIYFISADQALPFGTLTVLTEKWSEGQDADGKPLKNAIVDDDKDIDGYLLGLTMNAGGFEIKPALHYKDNQSADQSTTKFMVATTGKLGTFDIESEFTVADYSDDNDNANEGTVFGAWVDASTNVAGLTVNTGILYGSADDAVAFVVGDELCPMEILGDDILIDGATLARVKVAKSITEKVGVDFSAAYAFTNLDDKYKAVEIDPDKDGIYTAKYAFDKCFEFDANASYKASDAVTLSTGIAFLDGDFSSEKSFDQARIDAYAKINVAF